MMVIGTVKVSVNALFSRLHRPDIARATCAALVNEKPAPLAGHR